MKHTSLIRLGAMMSIAGGVLYAVASLLGDPYVDDVPRTWARIFEGFLILFLVGVMALIVALHLLQRERYGRKGALASTCAIVGVVGVSLTCFGFDPRWHVGGDYRHRSPRNLHPADGGVALVTV